ncbi:toll/interleukin-1 receptor domain-containing protein [Streptomyces sp. NBC_00986]|uniref:toll/interleukin-1 receptor domain-containing protein n=1 Tax=Streptomyces sp. NBC_00986 TaxID=2903702 RepID=UPI003863C487|nr:toll/interleukin-1 receptor domain-containing protein [Streptomyces sp. NBC_00986]
MNDGFSWTILFLGDSGEVSREFLLHYGVDLSIATAHRVRFVFFSEIPEREMYRFQEARAYGRSSRRSFLDLLERALRSSPRRRRYQPLDWEGDPWRELRPGALTPFTRAQDVHRHLRDDYEFSELAIPGAEASVGFAQILGIGRHVPCLLMFTDLGAPQYHILPIGDLTAAEAYSRVRGWIDSFYETNHFDLTRWSSVEQQIQRLAAQAHRSLRSIQSEPAQRKSDWLSLSTLAECARIARERPAEALRTVQMLPLRSSSQWRIGGELHNLQQRGRELESREETGQKLSEIARALQRTTDLYEISVLVGRLSRRKPAGLSPDSRQAIEAASAVFRASPPPVPPDVELFMWWRDISGSPFSPHQFLRLRRAWRAFQRPQQRADESDAEQEKRDYAAFWTALGHCPLSARAEDTAEIVRTHLARHYGVAPSEPAWLTATEKLRDHVVGSVRKFQRKSPSWLLQWTPPALLHECLLPSGQRDENSLRQFLASSTRLAAATRDRSESSSNRFTVSDEVYFQHRNAISRMLLEDARRTETVPESRASFARDTADYLERVRAEFQAEMQKNSETVFNGSVDISALKDDLAVAERLGAALDEYDEAVRGLVYPYVNDPRVIPLRTPPDLLQATIGSYTGDMPTGANAILRDAVRQTRDDTGEVLAAWQGARKEAARWTPEARLAEVITAVMTPARTAEALAPFPGATAEEKVSRAVQDKRAVDLLAALRPEELALVLKHARPSDAPCRPQLLPEEKVTPTVVLSYFGLSAPPRVFISYAHEDDGGVHAERVRALWLLLRARGVDARLDLSAAEEPQDWALWMQGEFSAADYVLVIASPAYKRRAEGTEVLGAGEGVIWETRGIRSEVYACPATWYRRILRVVLPDGSREDLPNYLGGHTVTYYTVDPIDDTGVEKLLRYLTRQPYEVEPLIGTPPLLPPRGAE